MTTNSIELKRKYVLATLLCPGGLDTARAHGRAGSLGSGCGPPKLTNPMAVQPHHGMAPDKGGEGQSWRRRFDRLAREVCVTGSVGRITSRCAPNRLLKSG